MCADGCVLTAETLEHVRHLFEPVDAELIVEIALEPARLGERFDGLDAAQGRTRDDLVEWELGECLDERFGLAPAALVQRPDSIISLPRRRVACPGVSDEEEAQRIASARPATTSSSRSQDSCSGASASDTQRSSSTPSPGNGSAQTGNSMAQ